MEVRNRIVPGGGVGWRVPLPGRVGWLVALGVLLAASTAQAEPVTVDASALNLRSGAATSYPVVQRLPRGTRVDVLSAAGSWSRVRAPDGTTGFASSRYLSGAGPAATGQSASRTETRARGEARARSSTARRRVTTSRRDTRAVRRAIRASIAAYPGNCPCPYSSDRAARRCGGRSAWSRQGGYAPLCYASDLR